MAEPILISEEYIVVVDTNSPAVNFYKEFCAFCTGFDHEALNTMEWSDAFYHDLGIKDDNVEDNPFYNFILLKKDMMGDDSPCSVWLNKKYGCNASGEYALLSEENYDQYNFPAPLSVGFYFDSEPQAAHIAILKDRAEKFFGDWEKEKVNIEGMRLIVHSKYGEEILL